MLRSSSNFSGKDFRSMNSILNPSLGHIIMSRSYRLHPSIEELLYADELEDGLIVLVESSCRAFTEGENDENGDEYSRIWNRWCEVSKLRIEGDSVFFIGIYADGDKQVRRYEKTTGFLVKKDSISMLQVKQNLDGAMETNIANMANRIKDSIRSSNAKHNVQ